jgi:hypothetical protein
MLERSVAVAVPTVQRCGPAGSDCGCSATHPLEPGEDVAVQRDGPGTASDPFGLFGPPADRLQFTNKSFPDLSQPTVCPRCHDDRPTFPQFPRYVDREATESRLVSWAQDSERMLHHRATIRILQLDPAATDTVVDDYGVGLTKRITSSHEFTGSDASRDQGAETIRERWGDIRPPVRNKLATWYENELVTAVAMTPKYAAPLVEPEGLRNVLTTRHGGVAPLGRWGAVAVPGGKYGIFEIDDIGDGQVWFHLPGRPVWLYQISFGDFVRHDPFVAAVAEQVADRTKWILELTPLLVKVGAFGLGFSGSIALVIVGIVLDELAEEMQADVEGRPGRTPEEILGSAGMQLLVDRIFHGLLGGTAGRAAASAGRGAGKIERIAEKAIPAVRRELAAAEKPLVKEALEQGTARRVTDEALKAEGYLVEVAVESAGKHHLYRLNEMGRWCRSSATVCDLDLGADLAAAAKSPASFTKAKLDDARALMADVKGEMDFLRRIYDRMRAAGRVDVSQLNPVERMMLDALAPHGDAARLTLAELRDLPRALGLGKEFAAAAATEQRLIQQLYREGRPLYEIMRAASPSYAASTKVLSAAGSRDAVTLAVPRSGALHVDHVVPLNDIVRMPGFDKLRPERQLEIVNDIKNLRAIDATANTSRGDRSWWSWPQAAIYYDAAGIARMRALEDELRTYLAGRILALSRP